jgi:hypothetical protein
MQNGRFCLFVEHQKTYSAVDGFIRSAVDQAHGGGHADNTHYLAIIQPTGNQLAAR